MNWDGVPVLVTGAGGFIGSHLIERLIAAGASVRAFVRYTSSSSNGNLDLLPSTDLRRMEIVRGDLRDPDAVVRAMAGSRFVFHLGALIAIPYSYIHPREVIDTNVFGTLNVLEAARQHRPERVVHISTSEVYGTAQRVPIDETHPLQGQSPYSASKIGADKVAESYFRAFDVPVATVRPFNTYGPRQSARAVIPTIITQALTGSVVRLGSLSPTRDFTFVADTAAGMMRAAELEATVGREVNLGSGEEISIGDLASKVIELIGRPVSIEEEDARFRPGGSEVERLRADATKAHELLAWHPTVGLAEGLRATIEWISDHLDRYSVGHYEV